jgi:mannose-6-phosphate isomerase-like protein (cupin superfamily)
MTRLLAIVTLCLVVISVAACQDKPVPAAPPQVVAPRQPAAPTASPSPGGQPTNLVYQRFVLNPEPVYQELLVGPPQTGGMRSGRVVLLAGQEMGRHSTKDNEEMLVFLKGKGRVALGSQTIPMEEGQALYVPPQSEHGIFNDGPGELRYMYIVAPAGR